MNAVVLETPVAYEVLVAREDHEPCLVCFLKAWPGAEVGALSLALCIELEEGSN